MRSIASASAPAPNASPALCAVLWLALRSPEDPGGRGRDRVRVASGSRVSLMISHSRRRKTHIHRRTTSASSIQKKVRSPSPYACRCVESVVDQVRRSTRSIRIANGYTGNRRRRVRRRP